MTWFEVDRAGLRQLWGDKDKRFLLFELIANVLDEPGVTECNVKAELVPGKRQARIVVEDDAPDGFIDITHAYTLFAHTRKRGKANVRGRFNIGEKHVLSLAESAVISTTTGTVEFGPGGRHLSRRRKREKGSVVDIVVKLTKGELKGILTACKQICPPPSIELMVNGERIESRPILKSFETALATELEDESGVFRPTVRNTEVRLYPTRGMESALLYELGIPVMPIEDRWHIDVQQKIPLTIERDNVKPSFLRDLRAEVLNRMAGELDKGDVAEKWVRDGMSDERIEPQAVDTIATKRWGDKRCVIPPGNNHAREQAVLNGYTIVNSSELSREEWENVRQSEAIVSGGDLWKRDTAPSEIISRDKWTRGMKSVARVTEKVAGLMKFHVRVLMIESPDATVDADYKDGVVRFNVSRLGRDWFDGHLVKVLPLVIHELGHKWGGHLDPEYIEGLCKIGAKLAMINLKDLEE